MGKGNKSGWKGRFSQDAPGEVTACNLNKMGWLFFMSFNLFFTCGGLDGKASTCNAGDPGSMLGQEDPLEKGMATHSSIGGAWRATVRGVTKSQARLSD